MRKKWIKRYAGEFIFLLAMLALTAVSVGIGILIKNLGGKT